MEFVMAEERDNSMARVIAPEDIRPGIFVAPLYEVEEYRPWFDMTDMKFNRVKSARVLEYPWSNERPMKVLDVCLPFVMVADAEGEVRTLDVRRYRLAQIRISFAQALFKIVKAKKKRSKAESRK